jgi:mono/diheme cytochrome c family protein
MKAKLVTGVVIVGLAVASGMSLSAQGAKSQWDGVYTAEQATRGEAVYAKYKCLNCHGTNLQGYVLEMNPAPELIGDPFVKAWADFTLGDMYEKIHMTMPQDDPGTMKPEEVADVIAYILSRSKYPAGTTELSPKVEDLKGIKFLAAKP